MQENISLGSNLYFLKLSSFQHFWCFCNKWVQVGKAGPHPFALFVLPFLLWNCPDKALLLLKLYLQQRLTKPLKAFLTLLPQKASKFPLMVYCSLGEGVVHVASGSCLSPHYPCSSVDHISEKTTLSSSFLPPLPSFYPMGTRGSPASIPPRWGPAACQHWWGRKPSTAVLGRAGPQLQGTKQLLWVPRNQLKFQLTLILFGTDSWLGSPRITGYPLLDLPAAVGCILLCLSGDSWAFLAPVLRCVNAVDSTYEEGSCWCNQSRVTQGPSVSTGGRLMASWGSPL